MQQFALEVVDAPLIEATIIRYSEFEKLGYHICSLTVLQKFDAKTVSLHFNECTLIVEKLFVTATPLEFEGQKANGQEHRGDE